MRLTVGCCVLCAVCCVLPSLVVHYCSQESVILLCILDSQADSQNQTVFNLTNKYDRNHQRTSALL